MSALVICLIFMLIAAAVIILVCVIAYNRRMDKVANGEVRDRHSRIPDPETTVNGTYRIVLMAIATISMISIGALSGMVSSLQSSISSLKSDYHRLCREFSDLQEQPEADRRLIADYHYEVEDLDYSNRTAEISLTVRLKEFTNDTKVTLQQNEKDIPLVKNGSGIYSGRFTAGLFDSYSQASFLITQDGKTVAESAELPESYVWEVLPMPSLACSFSSDVSFGKLKYEGSYLIETACPEEIESVSVTYMTGGRDLMTLDVTEETLNEQEIRLEKGLDLEDDLTFRIEILTKSGFRIVNRSVMIYDASLDVEDVDFLKVLDAGGNVVWESE